MNHPGTARIVARVLSGDIDAYREIIRCYQQDVWRAVAGMLFSTAPTEDLVQQTFIKAYQHLRTYDPTRDFGAWIKQIARNEARQALRAGTREHHWLECYHKDLFSSAESANPGEGDDRLAEALQHCVAQLAPAAAQLVELRYQNAWDFGRIAAFLGRTVEATRQHLSRIRLILRDCIEKRLAQL